MYGGDVMKFAGDSMIVAFYASPDEATAPDQGLRSATMRGVRCAAELSAKCGELGGDYGDQTRSHVRVHSRLAVLRSWILNGRSKTKAQLSCTTSAAPKLL